MQAFEVIFSLSPYHPKVMELSEDEFSFNGSDMTQIAVNSWILAPAAWRFAWAGMLSTYKHHCGQIHFPVHYTQQHDLPELPDIRGFIWLQTGSRTFIFLGFRWWNKILGGFWQFILVIRPSGKLLKCTQIYENPSLKLYHIKWNI